jgi:hypothetical protein
MDEQFPLSFRALRRALAALLDAHRCASNLTAPPEHFAVLIAELRRHRVSDATLRWLCAKQYAEHLIETTGPGDAERKYQATTSTLFRPTSCFLLTPAGIEFAESVLAAPSGKTAAHQTTAQQDEAAAGVPRWDAQSRQLWVGPRLVKSFRQPAPAQETILAAFQEEGWPFSIDDPLPPKRGVDSRERLHDTIKRLNQHQMKVRKLLTACAIALSFLAGFIGQARSSSPVYELHPDSDAYEPNETASIDLMTFGQDISQLSIFPQADVDLYNWTSPKAGTLTVAVTEKWNGNQPPKFPPHRRDEIGNDR